MDSSLARIQAISGATLSGVLLAHLSGHALSIVSYEWANRALLLVRPIYQHPLLEPIFAVTLATHGLASLARVWLRKSKSKSKDKSASQGQSAVKGTPAIVAAQREIDWHRKAGYTLAFFISGHIFAVRLFPLYHLVDPSVMDLSMVTYSAMTYPYFFPIYYAVLGTAGLYHALYGTARVLKLKTKRGVMTWVGYGSLAVMTLTSLALSGFLYPIDMTKAPIWKEMQEDMVHSAGMGLLG
ncbi:uncharacterized protein BJ171DRAFT_474425 [Polychytrium aggregatum]|uniref:uncharacterized protein n=1 Tax=Polychytrium aggregatum TaxID=110093 RepID=UPI0022FF0361|nr:uncharacterized protein BJ171DRAFT_474425 [Polychytrium aggregatum]KAI9204999.1 hypothetical protein BJ171DRAFT_474425 [Polychytrium aggregatum]